MKFFGSTKNLIDTAMKMVKMCLFLEITEVVLVHYNIVNNYHQQNSRVLYTFIPNELFCQLLDISPKNC